MYQDILRRRSCFDPGAVETLKHVKKDVEEARKGLECGMGFTDFTDFKEGDEIQCYEDVEIPRTL